MASKYERRRSMTTETLLSLALTRAVGGGSEGDKKNLREIGGRPFIGGKFTTWIS